MIDALPLLLGPEGYQISRSVRLRSSASAYFNRTFGTPTDNLKWTWSAWAKLGLFPASGYGRCLFGGGANDSGNNTTGVFMDTSNKLYLNAYSGGASQARPITTAVFRDPSAWYHVVCVYDSANATQADRFIFYVNGVRQAVTGTLLSQNLASKNNANGVVNRIGMEDWGTTYGFDGYLTEVNFIDGQALTPSSFGETNPVTGVWQPKKYTGTYGTNGFYLNFADNTNVTNVLTGNTGIGKDSSGNGNYWSSNNISLYGGTTQSFTSTGTTSWTAPAGVTSVQYLIVGGGGGGTNYSGGGGGSVVTGTMSVTPGSSYSVTVGAGGSGGVTPTDGADSAFAGVTATKGLKAASAYVGGASGSGFAGGTGANLANPYLGGGGGGAGGAGNNRSGTTAGAGGVGVSVTIGSTTSTYGGGGGGGAEGAGSRGVGGSGGGGNGSGPVGSPAGSAGTANTGGGGGGGDGGNTTSGFAGGSGTVILAYGSSATYDSMLDVPTQWADGGNGRGNYCTFNPLVGTHSNTYSNGNLQVATSTANAAFSNQRATFGVSSGKWYWEITCQATSSAFYVIGITADTVNPDTQYIGQGNSYSYRSDTGQKATNGTFSTYGATFTTGDIIGVEFDADAGTLVFYKNNVSQGTAFTSISGTYFPAVSDLDNNTGRNSTFVANFGQRPFSYTPPSGFKALNTLNLPTPTILKGNQYFDATLWTGNGGSQTITNSGGMQPDFAWVKKRSGAENHELTDAVRGANLRLASSSTGAESAGGIAFNSTGLSLTGGYGTDNENGQTYVGWQWKEGATQGFDIVTYTGDGTSARAISHSLGVAPKMIIIKQRNAGTYGWVTYHASVGAGSYLTLNGTGAAAADTTMFNNTAPTSSVFTLSSGGNIVVTNPNTGTMVAYLFAEVAGFSKFGSYTGNGSSDGVFVHLGFRARYLLIKETGNANSWEVYDTARNSANVQTQRLFPNDSLAEATTDPSLDILSNGFKCRAGNTGINRSGGTYIYAAFAENPFKNALAR